MKDRIYVAPCLCVPKSKIQAGPYAPQKYDSMMSGTGLHSVLPSFILERDLSILKKYRVIHLRISGCIKSRATYLFVILNGSEESEYIRL